MSGSPRQLVGRIEKSCRWSSHVPYRATAARNLSSASGEQASEWGPREPVVQAAGRGFGPTRGERKSHWPLGAHHPRGAAAAGAPPPPPPPLLPGLFYYAADRLLTTRRAGALSSRAELMTSSPLRQRTKSKTNGLYIGGSRWIRDVWQQEPRPVLLQLECGALQFVAVVECGGLFATATTAASWGGGGGGGA